MRIRRTAGTVVLAGLMMVAGGCGGGGGGGDAGTAYGNGDEGEITGDGPTMTITFDIEGEETLKGEATERTLHTINGKNPESCAEYARGSTRENGKTYFVLPLQLGGPAAGRNVGLQVLVKEYTGPGLYTADKLTADGVSYGIRLDNRPYVAQGDPGAAVTVDAKGGGTFTFEKLAYSTGADISPGISGQVSWTCTD